MKEKYIYIIISILAGILFIIYCVMNKNTLGWRKIDLGEVYSKSDVIEMDLNSDGINETIEIKEVGKNIIIDDEEYTLNDGIDGYKKKNQFQFSDINNDGSIEIIHKTTDTLLPKINIYTIYKYNDFELTKVLMSKSENSKYKRIDTISIEGNIPNTIYAKDSMIKFEYNDKENMLIRFDEK